MRLSTIPYDILSKKIPLYIHIIKIMLTIFNNVLLNVPHVK